MSLLLNGTDGVTYNDGTLQSSAPVGRNRIINGNMTIDQRNAGASVTPASGTYTLDRWVFYVSQSSKLTAQQNAGSVTPPVGFSNYLGVTSSSAYSVLAGDYFGLVQNIEGFNTADLGWGTANAKTVTLSFQVYSSLTGTFGGVVKNSASNRTYPFTYSISSANTWTTATVTIAGDTTGTWVGATNGIGIQLIFGLGVGSTYSGTAGSWAAANYLSATGATSVVGTSGATFYITGVQLETGTTATDFENLQYGTQLSLCQRYYQKSYAQGTVPGANVTSTFNEAVVFGGWGSENVAKLFTAEHKIPLRPGTQSLSFWDMAGNATTLSSFDNGFTRTDNRSPSGGNAISENRHYVAPGTTTYNAYAWAYAISSEL
jgi:hypothetical protein